VLAELGLSHVATSLVGGSASIRGVSGGERRRVTIAMALVTRPRLVIMDEPTSGLDSYTAYNLMRTAQDIAKHGRVVIMSLHQPSPDMFDSLSQVLLLAKGRLAYLGTPAGVGPSFAAAGYPCPPGRQPAEHMLHVASQPAGLASLLERFEEKQGVAACSSKIQASGSYNSSCSCPVFQQQQQQQQQQRKDTGSTFELPTLLSAGGPASTPGALMVDVQAGQYDVSRRATMLSDNAAIIGDGGNAELCAGGSTSIGQLPSAARRSSSRGQAREWAGCVVRECAVLYWRAFTNIRREPRLLMLHVVVALALGVVVGAIFFKLDLSQIGVQNRLGAMFFALALFGWTSVSVVDGLVLERELVEREVAGHYYSGSTYLLSSLVLDGLLLRTLPALLFSALVYPMVRQLLRARKRGCCCQALCRCCHILPSRFRRGAIRTGLRAKCHAACKPCPTSASHGVVVLGTANNGHPLCSSSICHSMRCFHQPIIRSAFCPRCRAW
jgi:energy-coupling factor transporter ATP-binding protein EcfA2